MDLNFKLPYKSFDDTFHELLVRINEIMEIDDGERSHNEILLFRIRDKSADAYQMLLNLHNQWTAYTFVRKDKELKMKMPDLWSAQSEQLKNGFKKALEDFKKYVEDHNWKLDDIIKELESFQ